MWPFVGEVTERDEQPQKNTTTFLEVSGLSDKNNDAIMLFNLIF